MVVVAPLVPWSIAGGVPLASIAAPTASIFFACYLYLLPLWRLSGSLLRRTQVNHFPSPDCQEQPGDFFRKF